MADMAADKPAQPMAIRAFARLRGCSHEAIRLAIRDGRLAKALVWDANGKPKIADPDLAMKELDANTDLSRATPAARQQASSRRKAASRTDGAGDGRVFDLAAESAREKHWKANIAELEYRVRAGELVPVDEVERKFGDAVTAAKTKLLGLPRRIQQRLPALDAEDVRVIHELVREALEDLAYGR